MGYNYDSKQGVNYAQGNGSLLSVLYTLDNTVRSIGNPLNMGYFASKSLDKVPFVGRAFAQTGYQAPLIDEVYFSWRIVRNLAFGVFAILMLIVGLMMINRTRLNPQSVVTIQYALPKIIIAIFLVAFSYPIGALIVSTRGAIMYPAPLRR